MSLYGGRWDGDSTRYYCRGNEGKQILVSIFISGTVINIGNLTFQNA